MERSDIRDCGAQTEMPSRISLPLNQGYLLRASRRPDFAALDRTASGTL